MGIKDDLDLHGDQYQWLGSLFYFGKLSPVILLSSIGCLYTNHFTGYLAWEYPTNRLLQRLPLGKYSAACILIWGLILCCFAAVKNYSGAIAIRFMLGVFEAAVTPGFALLTSQVWFNPSLLLHLYSFRSTPSSPTQTRLYTHSIFSGTQNENKEAE
jgi:ACS family allantoate permease-like MFS transporter